MFLDIQKFLTLVQPITLFAVVSLIPLMLIKLSATWQIIEYKSTHVMVLLLNFFLLKSDLAYVYHICTPVRNGSWGHIKYFLSLLRPRYYLCGFPMKWIAPSFWAALVHFKSATGQNILWKILMTRLFSQSRAHCLHNYLNDSGTKSTFARITQMVPNSLDNCAPPSWFTVPSLFRQCFICCYSLKAWGWSCYFLLWEAVSLVLTSTHIRGVQSFAWSPAWLVTWSHQVFVSL